jgi:hypothetical protein
MSRWSMSRTSLLDTISFMHAGDAVVPVRGVDFDKAIADQLGDLAARRATGATIGGRTRSMHLLGVA